MPVTKPYKRTCRQLIDGSYKNDGNGNYVRHPHFAEAPRQYLRAFGIIQKDLLELFDYVEPADLNEPCYSYRIHELHTRACIEVDGTITPGEARTVARKYAGAVANNHDPLAERVESRAYAARAARVKQVNDVLDEFMTRYVRKQELRTADEIESSLRRHVRPRIGTKAINELRRADIVEMLDAIEDKGSAHLADMVLALVRKAFNWWATRDEQFISPIVRGMARTKVGDLSRQRVLTDDEIRHVWKAFAGFHPEAYGRIGRVLMLTGARLNEIAALRWDEIDDGVFTIPASRHKAKTNHTLPILPTVAALIGSRPKGAEFVFSTQKGTTPFSGFSKAKVALDKKINASRKEAKLKPIPDWRLHDLRRTARSLMSRAGVTSDIAERVRRNVWPLIPSASAAALTSSADKGPPDSSARRNSVA